MRKEGDEGERNVTLWDGLPLDSDLRGTMSWRIHVCMLKLL